MLTNTIYGEVDTIIYLSAILRSDFWNLAPLYSIANYQRLVVSVTVMESLPIKNWAKGGELLLTSLKTLPEQDFDMKSLVDDMCILSIAALAVKCKQQDKNHPSLQILVQLAKAYQIPIFLIPENVTYLFLANGINLLLTQMKQLNILKEYLLRYMLLSENIKEDIVIKHCIQSLHLNFYEHKIQIYEFHLQTEHYGNENDLEQVKQMIFLKIYGLFDKLKTDNMMQDYLFMRSSNTIHIMVLITNTAFLDISIAQIQEILCMYKNVFIGISSIHSGLQIKTLFEEASFACKVGYTLQKQQIVTYTQVHLLRVIKALQEVDDDSYFCQIISPLIQHPFLMDTLLIYYRNNENQKATCEELFIHVNTLQYRLKKIEKLTGMDLHNIGDKMNLYVSLISYTMNNWRKTNDND